MKNILKNVLSALSDKNIKFSDLRKLILDLDFSERLKGSYHMITTQKVNKIYCRGTMHRAHRKNG